MQTLVIDTNGIIKKLERRDFSRAQAEGITEALKELDTAALITKSDLELALAQNVYASNWYCSAWGIAQTGRNPVPSHRRPIHRASYGASGAWVVTWTIQPAGMLIRSCIEGGNVRTIAQPFVKDEPHLVCRNLPTTPWPDQAPCRAAEMVRS
jgi:hypothetical protein